VDLEMTGLDVARDRVVEVCIERVVGVACEARLASLVRPEGRGGAEDVHGIDASLLEGAPAFGAIAGDVHRLLEGAVFVAHAADWDARFLRAEMARADAPLELPFYVDTLTLARRAFALPSYSLDALCKSLGLERGRAHRAPDDVRALRAVFERCVEVLAPVSPRDLWEVRIGARRARTAILDACEAAAEHAAPVRMTYRPRRRPAEERVVVVRSVRYDLEPPRILGYELPGRGRCELRADRILRVEPYAA
jgi:DNA polymerase III subunit epsilon